MTASPASDKRLTAYASTAAHGCIPQALECGHRQRGLRLIPTNDKHQIVIGALERILAEDRRTGFTPFLIVGTAGTVDIGGVDDLTALAGLAQREQL